MVDKVFVYEQQQLADFAGTALEHARKAGAHEAAVRLGESQNFSLSVRNGELDSFQYRHSKQISITVHVGERSGSSFSSDLSPDGLREAAQAAVAIARQTGTDAYAGVVEREDLASVFPNLDLYHPWALSTDDALGMARELEALSLRWPGHSATAALFPEPPQASLTSSAAGVSTTHGQFLLATSQGFSQGAASTSHSLSSDVIASNEQGMQAGNGWSFARSREQLLGLDAIAGSAAFNAVRRLGGQRLPSGSAAVVFEAPVAHSLFSYLFSAISGTAQYRNQSFLRDSLGTSVMASHIDITEHPHTLGALASASFDNEGVPTRERTLVNEGVLQTFLLDGYAARRLDMGLTGHAGGVRNARVHSRTTAPTTGLAELIKQMHRGLLVTDLLGGGVNPVTGDYSQGVSGFWVEQGVIRHAVEEITIAGNLRDIFNGIQAIADDTVPGASLHCGSVLVEHMRIAGL